MESGAGGVWAGVFVPGPNPVRKHAAACRSRCSLKQAMGMWWIAYNIGCQAWPEGPGRPGLICVPAAKLQIAINTLKQTNVCRSTAPGTEADHVGSSTLHSVQAEAIILAEAASLSNQSIVTYFYFTIACFNLILRIFTTLLHHYYLVVMYSYSNNGCIITCIITCTSIITCYYVGYYVILTYRWRSRK